MTLLDFVNNEINPVRRRNKESMINLENITSFEAEFIFNEIEKHLQPENLFQNTRTAEEIQKRKRTLINHAESLTNMGFDVPWNCWLLDQELNKEYTF